MNFLFRLGFVLKEGFTQILRTRGPSTAIVVIIASTLLQLSIFLGITRGLDRVLDSAQRKFEMALFLSSDANASDRKRVEALLTSDPRVAEVKVITKEEALQEYRGDPEIDRMIQALGENCGIVVSDPETGECVFRFRKDWNEFSPEEGEILAALAEDLPLKYEEMGAEAFLRWIDESLSNSFRVEPPAQTICIDLQRTAQALYRRHVKTEAKRYVTHLPLIPIDLAAGGLGTDRAKGAEEWVEVEIPGRARLSDDLFLVRIHGRSMEPDIPDGSICLFRTYQGGSRSGGIYIVQRLATMDDGGEFTIKRYKSVKRETAQGWHHENIEMQPDNPDFQDWSLAQEENRWVTVAQFLHVLEDPIAERP